MAAHGVQPQFSTLAVSGSQIADSLGLDVDYKIFSSSSKQSKDKNQMCISEDSASDDICAILAQWVEEETAAQQGKKNPKEHFASAKSDCVYDPVRLLREADICKASRPPSRFLRG